jgi:aminoglycoside phosphotransferase (APT) family kinase protein
MGGAQRRPGELVTRGTTSDIWEWTPGTVVKLLRPGIPEHWAGIEADITLRVHAAGLPAPATDGVIEVDGRLGVVLERVDGETMWERMKSAPDEVPHLIGALVDIQTEFHRAPTIDGLPLLTTRLERKIGEARQLSEAERAEALGMLARSPRGTALCHGDMHPANIVMAARGMVIVDWFDAAVGHAGADLARSSLLMRPAETEASSLGSHLGGATDALLRLVHCAYLTALMRRQLISPTAFTEWEAILAVARMSEPVPTDDLVRVWQRWRTAGTRPTSRDLEECLDRAQD